MEEDVERDDLMPKPYHVEAQKSHPKDIMLSSKASDSVLNN